MDGRKRVIGVRERRCRVVKVLHISYQESRKCVRGYAIQKMPEVGHRACREIRRDNGHKPSD